MTTYSNKERWPDLVFKHDEANGQIRIACELFDEEACVDDRNLQHIEFRANMWQASADKKRLEEGTVRERLAALGITKDCIGKGEVTNLSQGE